MTAALRATWLVGWREFRQLVSTPLFWVMSGVFFIAASIVYLMLVLGFANAGFREENDISANITIAVIRDLFAILHFFLLVQAPLLTMRTLAEERRQGTLALVMTTPAGEWSIVLGKFAANAAALLLFLSFTLVFPLLTEWISEPEWPIVLSCYAALVLVACAYSAIGVFFSSLAESQVVAAVLTYVALFVLLVLSGISDAITNIEIIRLLEHATVLAHLEGFLVGNLSLADGAYFVLFTALFLFLAARVLESGRWRA